MKILKISGQKYGFITVKFITVTFMFQASNRLRAFLGAVSPICAYATTIFKRNPPSNHFSLHFEIFFYFEVHERGLRLKIEIDL